jgi:hypothetical protein
MRDVPSTEEGRTRADPRWERLAAATGIVAYPEGWKTSLDAATIQAKFRVILLNHELANSSNITAAYVWPNGNEERYCGPLPSPATHDLLGEG